MLVIKSWKKFANFQECKIKKILGTVFSFTYPSCSYWYCMGYKMALFFPYFFLYGNAISHRFRSVKSKIYPGLRRTLLWRGGLQRHPTPSWFSTFLHNVPRLPIFLKGPNKPPPAPANLISIDYTHHNLSRIS